MSIFKKSITYIEHFFLEIKAEASSVTEQPEQHDEIVDPDDDPMEVVDENYSSFLGDSQTVGDETERDNSLYEKLLREMYKARREEEQQEEFVGTAHKSKAVADFENELNAFEKKYLQDRVDSRVDVVKFWLDMAKSNTFLMLIETAFVVLAAPGTQVSVERLFSLLKFILNDLRDNLSSGNLRNILIVKGNYEHLDENFFAQALKKIK